MASREEPTAEAGQPTAGGEKKDRFPWESWAGVFASMGLASILIVIIGRLWTTTYFDHFGLPSSGMEFSIYDFAFRSLEALISLALGAMGFIVAWFNREQLKRWGFVSAIIEFILILVLVMCVLFFLPMLPDSLLGTTGVLGLSSGLVLAAMLWFSVDVLEGPGGGFKNWPQWAQNPVKSLLGLLRVEAENASAVVKRVWLVVAAGLVVAIFFLYLPWVSERLAEMQAAADVATGEFAAAILESEDPLPDAIASSADPTRSNPVRLILTRSQNTYVLHSTDCTTIGELDVPIRVGDILPPEAPDVCKVFTIPTSRLKSIEYFQVSGKAPSNESLLHPREVSLGDEPFKESFSSQGAADEEELKCGEGPPFFNSIWFGFTPATNGAVLARVETGEFIPVVGIWQAREGATEVQPVPGSADDGSACEADVATVPEAVAGPDADAEERTKNVVGVVANVQAGTRYVASVGAQEDGGGLGRVSFEFTPGGYFFSPAITEAQAQRPEDETTPEPGTAVLGVAKAPEDKALVPQVEIVSGVGSAKLELWRLAPEIYELQSLAEMSQDVQDDFLPGKFTLKSEEEERTFNQKKNEDEEQPTALYVAELTEGVWKLVAPEDFAGLTKLTGTSRAPDLMLAFADTSGTPLKNAKVQEAVLIVLEESGIREELGYGGDVIFDPESFAEGLQIPPVVEEREFVAGVFLLGQGYEEGFPIQIRVEWESETLDAAAEIVQLRLLAIGLDARIEPCTDACIRVFFRTGD